MIYYLTWVLYGSLWNIHHSFVISRLELAV